MLLIQARPTLRPQPRLHFVKHIHLKLRQVVFLVLHLHEQGHVHYRRAAAILAVDFF